MSNWLVENSVLTLWDVCTVSVSYLDWVINGLCLLTRDSLFSYHLSMLIWSSDFYSWIMENEILASNNLTTRKPIWFITDRTKYPNWFTTVTCSYNTDELSNTCTLQDTQALHLCASNAYYIFSTMMMTILPLSVIRYWKSIQTVVIKCIFNVAQL